MVLTAEVFVTPQIDVNPAVTLPFTGAVKWSPISSTLIMGDREAILVDTAITRAQNDALVDWVAAKMHGRILKGVYITHGHADHFLGIKILQTRFSECKIFATAGTKNHMAEQLESTAFNSTWGTYFSRELPNITIEDIEAVQVVSGSELILEGCCLQVVELGHTDTHDSTALFVPDLALAICGDSVYGDVHCMLRQANTREKREEWVQAVKKIKMLAPRVVIAGHKKPDGTDAPDYLDRTIDYIHDFQFAIDSGAKDAKELFDRMMEKHGARLNPAALEVGCHAVFPNSS